MLDRIIRTSLQNRGAVLAAAFLLLVAGGALTSRLPVDIFPDLTAPTVTVITEAKGLAPEEVELLVTFPVESALNGASGVRRIRSVSGPGIGVVWVEFEWGEDVYLARQVVAERLQTVALPSGVDRPTLGPISSIMGEITFIALTSDKVPAMELRRLAETVVRRSLLAVPGISQVVPIGGDVREYLVELDPAAVVQAGISVEDVVRALEAASAVPAAGFHVDGGQEYLVRGLGRARSTEDLASTVLRVRDRIPLRLGQIATVTLAPEPARGAASYRGMPAVILSVQKQPGANTLALTRETDRVLDDMQRTLPAGVVIQKENFRQADFIEIAIHNVSVALRDGALLLQSEFDGPQSQPTKHFAAWTVDYEEQIIRVDHMYDSVAPDGSIRRRQSGYEIRYVYRLEFELLLRDSGLLVQSIYSDYARNEYSFHGERMLFVASREQE